VTSLATGLGRLTATPLSVSLARHERRRVPQLLKSRASGPHRARGALGMSVAELVAAIAAQNRDAW